MRKGKVLAIPLAVAVLVAGCAGQPPGDELLPKDDEVTAWVPDGGRTVLLEATTGLCDKEAHAQVEESPEKVRIGVFIEGGDEPCLLAGVARVFEIPLSRPLGDRELVANDDAPYRRARERPTGKQDLKLTIDVVD
ncbi:hypothetical protein EDD29_8006 [Actinocorallia herbida]|uniref:Lipoprotein n=1 Tax=Actinocorallia herbida TaxID=58109 RepID=A0A3N1D9U6_9ACTN|nr:hypothetical protein [Actinocorallia herbida]ROO90284.1 hypothetical protein EDD29_8006 [Actinocorallia herbida]